MAEIGQNRTTNGINYTLFYKKVRNLNLRVHRDGTVALSVPRRCPVREADAFVASKAAWIARAQARMAAAETQDIVVNTIDRDDAAAMLRRLSGATHTVVSGVTLRTAERSRSFGARTDVRFRPLAGEEIAYYLDTFRPYDKAGSYGIQEWIGYAAIERIEGSFYNVMGLPVQKLYVELNEFLG